MSEDKTFTVGHGWDDWVVGKFVRMGRTMGEKTKEREGVEMIDTEKRVRGG